MVMIGGDWIGDWWCVLLCVFFFFRFFFCVLCVLARDIGFGKVPHFPGVFFFCGPTWDEKMIWSLFSMT